MPGKRRGRTSPDPEPPDGADLDEAVRRARDGDEDAFLAVYCSVHPRLLRYLRVLVGEDAEDVASETWLHVVRDLGSFRGDADGFRGWTATIARNRAMDHLRRARRRPVQAAGEEVLADLPGRADTVAEALESIGTDAALALISRLPREQAEAVMLRAVLGLDAPAAAKILGKRPGAVRVASHRGLRTLAEHLDRLGGPDGGLDGQQAPGARRPGDREGGQAASGGAPRTGVTAPRASTLRDAR